MTHTHIKSQIQSSVGSTDRVETNRRTDRRTDMTDYITFPAVGKNKKST